MIYMEPQSLGWLPLLTSWLESLPSTLTETYKSIIVDLFERFIDPSLLLIRKGGIKVGLYSHLLKSNYKFFHS